MHAPKTMQRLGENGMSSLCVFKGLLNDIDIVLLTLDHAKTRCCENKWMLEHPFESQELELASLAIRMVLNAPGSSSPKNASALQTRKSAEMIETKDEWG